MQTLAELIGRPPPGDVQLLQAIVVAAPSAGTATIRLGGTDTNENLSGVRILATASIVNGDTVWVLRFGGALLIIGKINPGSPNSSAVFSDGLELYHPSSLPYIDFHRAANPAGDSNADYNVRLINDVDQVLSIIGGGIHVTGGTGVRNFFKDVELTTGNGLRVGAAWGMYGIYSESGDVVVGSATGVVRLNSEGTFLDGNGWTVKSRNYMGLSGAYGGNYAQFSHSSFWNSSAYGYMQAVGGDVLFSCANSTIISFRQSNVEVGAFKGPVGDYAHLEVRTGADSGSWDQRVMRFYAPSRPGAVYYATGSNRATQFLDQGAGFDCTNNDTTAGVPCRASSYPGYSALATKREIRSMSPGAERERIKRLRPIRFKRPNPHKHVLCDGKGCEFCSSYGTPGEINAPFLDKTFLTDFVGFVAEEMVEVYPEVVQWDPSDKDDWMSEPIPTSIDYSALTAVLIAAVQDILERLEAIEKLPAISIGR